MCDRDISANAGISPFCLLFYLSVTGKRQLSETVRSRGDPKGRPNGRGILSLTTKSDMYIPNTGTLKRPRRPFLPRLRRGAAPHGIPFTRHQLIKQRPLRNDIRSLNAGRTIIYICKRCLDKHLRQMYNYLCKFAKHSQI